MVVTDLFDKGLEVTSIYDQKKHSFFRGFSWSLGKSDL